MVEQYKNEVIAEASPLIIPVTDINYVLYFREKLGEGIQSSVYRATYLQNGKDVAVKVEKRQMRRRRRRTSWCDEVVGLTSRERLGCCMRCRT